MEPTDKITNDGQKIRVTLDVYVFMEDNTYIAYAPSLDLSGYGKSEEDAIKSFSIVIEEYFSYGLSNNTLIKDLRAHGWKNKSFRQRIHKEDFFKILSEND